MSEPPQEPEDEDAILARLGAGFPAIIADVDQLQASLVGYAKCANAVYLELLKVFPAKRAQQMCMVLWDRLIIPDEGEPEFEGEEVQ